MNYEKIYKDLMIDRIDKKPQRLIEKRCGFYFEGHHITPKWMGGDGNSNRPKNNANIVLLTAREHFLAHWLLWRIHRNRPSALAFHKMISNNKNQNRKYSSRGYEEARLAFSETNKGNKYAIGTVKVVSEEQKKQHSEFMKGRFVGILNPSKRPDVRKKISQSLKGKKRTDAVREKLSIAVKNRPKIECPWCFREVDSMNVKKWHFEYCNKNPTQKKINDTSNDTSYNKVFRIHN
jgi:hypothetical protein